VKNYMEPPANTVCAKFSLYALSAHDKNKRMFSLLFVGGKAMKIIMNTKNLLTAQSGGPTAAINASLAGVIRAGVENDAVDHVYGAVHGIEGVLNDFILPLDNLDTELLQQTPAAYLGSCRNKLPAASQGPAVYEKIFNLFAKYNIGYFLYIGGNDSMDTVCKLSAYAREHKIDVAVIGIPKTIDNDLEITDHTPGFGSAAKYIATTVSEIANDSHVYFLRSVTIIEIMGRHAGWLTAASALARNSESPAPHLIYLPEVVFSKDAFIADIQAQFDAGVTNVIVAVSEGIKDKDGKFICEDSETGLDAFGHKMLSGAGKVLERHVAAVLGCKVRSVELNVSQRCAGHLLSKTDISEAFAIGAAGVQAAVNGETGKMMAFVRTGNTPYQIEITSTPIDRIANQEKKVPAAYISGRHDVSEAMLAYLRPLICGEIPVRYQDGLPMYLYRPKFRKE